MGVETFLAPAAFEAAAAAATVDGASLAAAAGALEIAILAEPIVVLGAGLAGAALGKALYDKYFPGSEPPALLPPAFGGLLQKQYLVTTQYKLKNGPVQTGTNTIPGPIYGVTIDYPSPNEIRYAVSSRTGKLFALQANKDDVEQPVTIVGIVPLDGAPDPGMRPRNFQQTPPREFPIVVPTPFILPGETEPTPLNPEVYPQPVTDPETKPDEKKVPGVIVKIPETGTQLEFTPEGVFRSRYLPVPGTPNVPTQQPAPPSTKKVAVEPCPCPDESPDLSEIICRLKTLQLEILNNGYNFTSNSVPGSTGGSVTGITDELVSATVTVTQAPVNAARQPYRAPNSDVIHAGWFSWTVNGKAGERIPLQFMDNSFYPPPECDGFKYAFNNDILGTGSYITRVKKNYIDNC